MPLSRHPDAPARKKKIDRLIDHPNLIPALYELMDLTREYSPSRMVAASKLKESWRSILEDPNIEPEKYIDQREQIADRITGIAKLVAERPDESFLDERTRDEEHRRKFLIRARPVRSPGRGSVMPSADSSDKENYAASTLTASGLNVTVGPARSRHSVGPIDLSLRSGDLLAVFGGNASGKTTLLHALAGQLAIDEGSLEYPALRQEAGDWSGIRDRILFVPQTPIRRPGRVRDYLLYQGALRRRDRSVHSSEELPLDDEVSFAMARFELTDHADKRWNELSEGHRMRFELASAMIRKPRLLILDEPLAPLDYLGQEQCLAAIAGLLDSNRFPVSVVLSSQHLYEIEESTDKLLVIRSPKSVGEDRTARRSRRSSRARVAYFDSDVRPGRGRHHNVFEVVTTVSEAEVASAARRLGGQAEIGSRHALIRVPVAVSGALVILELLEARPFEDGDESEPGARLRHFRDISESAGLLLLEDSDEVR